MTVKAGDRVERTAGNNAGMCKGDTGTIVEVTEIHGAYYASVRLDKNGEISANNYSAYLKLLGGKKSMPVHLNAPYGTKIRRINSSVNGLQIGDIVTLESRSKYSLYIQEKPQYSFDPSNFELAEYSEAKIAEALAVLREAGDVTFKPRKPAFVPIDVGSVGQYKVTIHKNKVTVGCTSFTFNKAEEIWNAVQKAKAYNEES